MRGTGPLLRIVLLTMICLAAGLAGGYSSLWQSLDHRLFAMLQGRISIEPDPAIRVIDVSVRRSASQGDRPEAFRARLAEVLTALSRDPQPPRVVVLDVWFSRDDAGLEPLERAIAALRARGVRVYAAVNLMTRQGQLTADPLAEHHPRLYREAFDGFGHSLLEYGYGVLRYRRDMPMRERAGEQIVGESRLPALPLVAGLAPERWPAMPESMIVPLGDDARLQAAIDRVPDDPARPVQLRALRGTTHVIVGDLAADSDNLLARPGPLLMAWAVSDLLAGRASASLAPLNRVLVSLLLAFSAAAAGWMTLALAFAAFRSRVAPPSWNRLLAALVPVALLVGAGLLWIVQLVVVASGHVAPLAWSAFCLTAAVAFAAWGAAGWVQESRTRTELLRRVEEQAIAYDAFVSYAHDPPENREWVRRHVAAPLSALRHADGRPWRVFFDERSIEAGRTWKREIELALLGTRCFVPVYSERYFDRPYCREEIELADQLRIEGRLAFVPVARITSGIPERYLRKVQYLDATALDGESAARTLVGRVQQETLRLDPGRDSGGAASQAASA